MAIEKQRYPKGGQSALGLDDPAEEQLTIELPEDPNIQTEETQTFELGPDGNMRAVEETSETIITDHEVNLAEVLDEATLKSMASQLVSDFEEDKESRQEWLDGFTKGLDLLGIQTEDREEPFPGAAGVTHPLLSEATTQFQAQAYKELLPPSGPVSTRIVGDENSETLAQSKRVKEFMNYQITEVMQDYDAEMDSLLFYLPLSGSAFKKVYFNSILDRAAATFVKADDLVVSYDTTNLETSPRITHVVNMTGNDIRKMQLSGVYRDIEIGKAGSDEYDEAKEKMDDLQGISRPASDYNQYTLLELHVDLELEGIDEYDFAVPYIVTILEDTNEILAIRRNWNNGDNMFRKKEYFVHYKFLPGLGFYGFGLIHMIGGLTKSATSILRQLIDAGTLSNLPAGFKARGMRVQGEDEPLRPGEFRDVDVPGGVIRDALMPLPYKEPSNVLAQLLGLLIDSGRRFASIADMQVGDIGSQQLPVGTTVAMLERGTKVMSAIHKRMHSAQKKEFRLLSNIFSKFLPPTYPYAIEGGQQEIKLSDFDDRIDIIPVSDPNIFSMSQRVMLAQQQLQMAGQAPQIHNLREAYKRMYEALEVKNIDAILPPIPEVPPRDPISEHQASMLGQPIKAFEFQNHEAYIAAHVAFLQNPNTQQNPTAVQAISANIQEHQAMLYKLQIEQVLGQPLPDMGTQPLPPEVMNELALVAAQATQQVTGQQQALIQAQQNAQVNPIVELEKEKLAQKDRADTLRTQVDLAKIESSESVAEMRIAQDREEALLKARENITKSYADILKDIRTADTNNKGA
jgi:hypothetical protein|tara:strand:+ start:22962 stop:25361 length:2400 start_codon:yes stop_codon:yes gene_type:complete